ncbi:radical SAM protein [bacterium]|nr:radical SAM protein [bacterium]
MLLIHPPVAKPCEPPAGIAKLSGALTAHGIEHTLLDANIEALLYTLDKTKDIAVEPSDKWTARALKNQAANLEALRGNRLYTNIDRYGRAIADLNRILEKSTDNIATLGLANYRDSELSPLRSHDLIRAADNPECSIFYEYFSRRLTQLIQQKEPSVIGFSLNYLSQALCTFAMIGYIKNLLPHAKVIIGGGLVTSWMSNPDWHNPFSGLFYTLISGPGEQQLLDIMGVSAIKENHYAPDYNSLPLSDYLAPGFILPYNASTGCYWNKCSFCPEKAEESPYIPTPLNKVMEDIRSLVQKTKPVLIHLLDNAVSPALLKRITEQPFDVPWYGFARINRDLTDPDFCRALKNSGCVMLKLGLESGDQQVLNKMHKGIDLKTASLALKTLKNAGIATYVYLIFGTPGETLPEARSTLDFVIRHKDEITFLNIAIFNMPVVGDDAFKLETKNFYDGDLSLYTDFVHPEGWNRKQIRQFLDNEFKRNKAVMEIIKRDPPIFTSNHAGFFVSSL